MGWASATYIFNDVAESLTAVTSNSRIVVPVLGRLIRSLGDGDWDTQDEAFSDWTHNINVIAAFAAAEEIRNLGGLELCSISLYPGYYPGYVFQLDCEDCGMLAQTPMTESKYNYLVVMAAEHTTKAHDFPCDTDEKWLAV